MQQPKTFKVKDVTYTVVMYDVDYGLTLLEDILVLCGEPVAQLLTKLAPKLKEMKDAKSMMEFDFSDIDIKPEQVTAIMAPLMAKIGGGKMNDLFKRILVGALPQGSSDHAAADYGTRFMGKYADLFMVVAKTLGAQYGDFLGVSAALAKAPKGAGAK